MIDVVAEPDDPKQYENLFKKGLRELIASLPSSETESDRRWRSINAAKRWLISTLRLRVTEQDLIARLSNLSRELSQAPEGVTHGQYCQAWHAVLILLRSKQSLGAAHQIVSNMERSISRTAALRSIMWGVVAYLGVTLAIVIYYSRYLDAAKLKDGILIYQFESQPQEFAAGYLFACIFGILGSIVSIFFRLSEFETLRGRPRTFLVLTGVFLPIVGSVFAVVIYAMFQSDVVKLAFGNVTVTSSLSLPVAVVIGFLCGFSERFARGMLERVAGRNDTKPEEPKQA